MVRVLAALPQLTVMITSREALHIYGEQEYFVPPLKLPDQQQVTQVSALLQSEAIALFVQRAQAVLPEFVLNDENTEAVKHFEVKPVPESDVFAGIPAFTVRDELYIHELQPGNEVHFTAKHEGQEVPSVWTRRYGKGRVCYMVPGHTTSSMRNTTYQKVLQRGLAWVCGE